MASQRVTLFFWPTSSASQKAWMALEEKQINFKSTIINIVEGEQNQASFLRINPAAQVPALQVGDKFLSESDVIIEGVDKLNGGTGPQLVPDPSTPEGKLVQYWRKKFSEVNIYVVTFGTILNPQLVGGKLDLPPAYMLTREGLIKKTERTLAVLETVKASNPDLAETVDKKVQVAKAHGDPDQLSEEIVEKALKSLEQLFDEVEAQLRKARTENILEHWLCGPNFTACDIFLAMMIGRLNFLNHGSRFLDPEKRPALVEYWKQLCRRPSVQKVVLGGKKVLMKYYLARKAKQVVVGTAAAAGVLALGLFIGHKYKS